MERALADRPEFMGIGCTTPLYHQATAIIELVKKRSPSTVVIFGGPHVSALPQATLDTSKADFVCIGEAEESVVAIVDHVLKKQDPADITGIAYRWGEYSGHTKEYRLRLHQSTVTTTKAIDLNRCPDSGPASFRIQGVHWTTRGTFANRSRRPCSAAVVPANARFAERQTRW